MKKLLLALFVVALTGCNALGSKTTNPSLKPDSAMEDLYRGGAN